MLDHQKIDAMLSTLKGKPAASNTCSLQDAEAMQGQLPPIDVLCVRHNDQTFYFAFGGCHRFQAYERQAQHTESDPMVRCKILPATKQQLSLYVGSSLDGMFEDVKS